MNIDLLFANDYLINDEDFEQTEIVDLSKLDIMGILLALTSIPEDIEEIKKKSKENNRINSMDEFLEYAEPSMKLITDNNKLLLARLCAIAKRLTEEQEQDQDVKIYTRLEKLRNPKEVFSSYEIKNIPIDITEVTEEDFEELD